jgi:hypothetical protein
LIQASALALAHAVFLACYLTEPARKWLVLACAAAFFSFFARVSSGSGSLFSLVLLDLIVLLPSPGFRTWWSHVRLPASAALATTATLVLAVSGWAGLNAWKFGSPFRAMPLEWNVAFDAERLARIKGSLVSPANLPMTLAFHLGPENIRWTKTFPWVHLTNDPRFGMFYPEAHFDGVEPSASLSAAAPGLLVAALAGTWLTFVYAPLRALRAPLAGAMAGCVTMFFHGYLTMRYHAGLLGMSGAWLGGHGDFDWTRRQAVAAPGDRSDFCSEHALRCSSECGARV